MCKGCKGIVKVMHPTLLVREQTGKNFLRFKSLQQLKYVHIHYTNIHTHTYILFQSAVLLSRIYSKKIITSVLKDLCIFLIPKEAK